MSGSFHPTRADTKYRSIMSASRFSLYFNLQSSEEKLRGKAFLVTADGE